MTNVDGASKPAPDGAVPAADATDAAAETKGQASQGRSHGASSSEDHWAAVLKRLAPQGYQKSPAWQQEIIERVVKQMSRRQKSALAAGKSKEELARTIDLQALGVSSDAADAFRHEEERVVKVMRELVESATQGEGGEGGGAGEKELSVSQQHLLDRQNQVHFYVRAIQMEQLLEQDLDADLRQMHDEVDTATLSCGATTADSILKRLDKQLLIIKKRCEALTMKASEIASENGNVRVRIDNLRKEKIIHRDHVTRMRTKALKMDEDIAFLTHAAHAALDQREKVRGKFLMAQRDMQQEREQKLGVIAELVQRTGGLEEEWHAKQQQMEDDEELRRRQLCARTRRQRSELEAKEVRFGYLASQARGWEAEFERLQQFTGMDTRFVPGDHHIVDEITSRYGEKERANTSLLRYLNEMQAEQPRLIEAAKTFAAQREEIARLNGVRLANAGGEESLEELEAAQAEEEARCERAQSLLLECSSLVEAIGGVLQRSAAQELPSQPCGVNTLEKWLQWLEDSVLHMNTIVHASCGAAPDGGAPPIAQPPAVLAAWLSRDKVSKLSKVTVPEIHEALCQQAAQQRRGGELEDDDDDMGEAEKKEAEARRSPFERKKVNKAQERQRIIDWARKRQPGGLAKAGPQTATQVEGAAKAAAAGPIKMSASAPTLRAPGSHAQGADRALPAADISDGTRSSCNLPAISEGGSARGSAVREGAGSRGVERRGAAERAAQYTSAHGAAPPIATLAPQGGGSASAQYLTPPGGGASMGDAGGRRCPAPGGRLRQAASASMPGLTGGSQSQTPKDLGTVIYLLGTQSSSMNARRFLRPDNA